MADNVRFSSEEISTFCSQIAMILNGGIPIYEGVHILAEQMEPGKTKKILDQIDSEVKDGKEFHAALADSGAFPEYMCEMVKVGEMTGKIEDIMRNLANFYERESHVKASIRSVIGYPTVLFAMMAVIIVVLVTQIIPMFRDIFLELDAGGSDSALQAGINAGTVIAIIVLAILAVIIFMLIWYRTPGGNKALTNLAYTSRLSGKLADKISTGKFVSAFAVMNAGGMENLEALENSRKVVENKNTLLKVDKCIEEVKGEKKLDDAMIDSGILTRLQGKMLGVASVSGNTDEVLYKISDQYDEEVNARLSSLSSVIETTLIVILSIAVGAILVSIMTPLISAIASIS